MVFFANIAIGLVVAIDIVVIGITKVTIVIWAIDIHLIKELDQGIFIHTLDFPLVTTILALVVVANIVVTLVVVTLVVIATFVVIVAFTLEDSREPIKEHRILLFFHQLHFLNLGIDP